MVRVYWIFKAWWDGLCDIHYDDTYGTDVEFSVSATAEFSHIFVDGSERETAHTLRARLSEHIDVDHLDQGELLSSPHAYESGVGMVSCQFVPRP
ncbi:MAG: hypothetical protein AAGH40_08435 [Verrucomicrobiota bacterium]